MSKASENYTKRYSTLPKTSKISIVIGILGILTSMLLQIDLYIRYLNTQSGKSRAFFSLKHLNIYPYIVIATLGILILIISLVKKENKKDILIAFILNTIALMGIILPFYSYFV